MFSRLGPPELLIILVIVILVFGPGRIGKIAGELGKGIKSFRDGLNESKEDKKDEQSTDSKGNIEPK